MPARNSKQLVEAYYTYRPFGGLEVRPNVQYVVNRGGMSHNRHVLVFGLKTLANI